VAVDVGQVYRASIDVTDVNNAPVNPQAATLTVTWRNATGDQSQAFALAPTAGQGTLPTPSPTGHVYYDWTFTEPGTYTFGWVTTGPGNGTADQITCRPYYAAVSLAEAMDWLGEQGTGQAVKVRGLVGLATRVAERIVGPTVPRRFTEEWIPGTTREVLRVPRPPLPDKTAVETIASVYPGGPAWPRDGALVVNPAAGTVRLASLLGFWWGPWTCTYTAGRLVLSEGITGGVLEILSDLWASQRWITPDSPQPDPGDVSLWESRLPPGYLPPPRAVELLQGDMQPGFG